MKYGIINRHLVLSVNEELLLVNEGFRVKIDDCKTLNDQEYYLVDFRVSHASYRTWICGKDVTISKELTEADVIDEMKRLCFTDDQEGNHATADDILTQFLTSLGYTDLVDLYNTIDKWYS